MILYKESMRMIVLDRRNNRYEEFRNKAVLADHLGLSHEAITNWFRKQENGLKPKTKMYNNLEIISIDGEYYSKHPNMPNNLKK